MIEEWKKFFKMFPDYKNVIKKVDAKDDLAILVGYAYWSEKYPYDKVIWTAKIVSNLIAEWRVYEDTKENRKKMRL